MIDDAFDAFCLVRLNVRVNAFEQSFGVIPLLSQSDVEVGVELGWIGASSCLFGGVRTE